MPEVSLLAARITMRTAAKKSLAHRLHRAEAYDGRKQMPRSLCRTIRYSSPEQHWTCPLCLSAKPSGRRTPCRFLRCTPDDAITKGHLQQETRTQDPSRYYCSKWSLTPNGPLTTDENECKQPPPLLRSGVHILRVVCFGSSSTLRMVLAPQHLTLLQHH